MIEVLCCDKKIQDKIDIVRNFMLVGLTELKNKFFLKKKVTSHSFIHDLTPSGEAYFILNDESLKPRNSI